MTKHSVLLAVLGTTLAAADASATPQFLDGAPAYINGSCPTTGSTVLSVGHYGGLLVDPAASQPVLNQITYVHAVAWELNPCVVSSTGDTLGFEFFLPPGASFAISPSAPVRCYIGNGSTSGASSGPCNQYVSTGNHGGAWFGYQTGMAPGWAFEIQVPVVFTQSTAANLRVTTTSGYGTGDTYALLTAPYSGAALPQSTQQQAPGYNVYADDIALLGSAETGSTLPVAWSNGNGTFNVTAYDVGDFASWARADRVQRVSGDFNADGYRDFALVGGPNWASIPVATSNANGTFSITNKEVGFDFSAWARMPNVKALAGDFNHDGYTDIALTGAAGWGSVPIAFNTGDGNFSISNRSISNFAGWAATPGVKPIVGDYNKDGFADIALVGGQGWATVPVAFSYGDGQFLVTNREVFRWTFYPARDSFAYDATQPNVKVVTGDFNKDGFSDLALVGGAGWGSIKVALATGNGWFNMVSASAPSFAASATVPNVQVLTGDFNGDGYTDLALTGGTNWVQIPLALSTGWGNFSDTGSAVGNFAIWAGWQGVRALTGDFNGDGYTDIALTGGAGWSTLPVAMSAGYGNFNVSNNSISGFASWSTDGRATAQVGDFNY